MGWEAGEMDPRLGAYADWELAALLARQRAEPVFPVYVRLNLASGSDADVLINRLNAQRGQFFVPDYEMDLIRTEIAQGGDGQADIRAMIYCERGSIENELWTVLNVGSPVPRQDKLPPLYQGRDLTSRTTGLANRPIIAVIDDAIGFLNARFRADAQSTRFGAVWEMGRNQAINLQIPAAGNGVYTGKIYDSAEIDTFLRSGRDESGIYHHENDLLLAPDDHKGTNFRAGHGTHVLDIAAGAEPGSAEADTRLLAVQLPPNAIVATSGRRLEHLVLQGLRWVMARALSMAAEPENGGKGIPLIVNISLGSLAGPKDSTELMAAWIPQEIRRFQRLSNPPRRPGEDTPIRIVAAYGNAYRDRLAARCAIPRQSKVAVTWRILPDDHTASFLEIRVDKGKAADVALRLAPPGEIPVLELPQFLTPNQKRIYLSGGDIAAGVYWLDEVAHDAILVVVAATVTDDGGAMAPAGGWEIELSNTGAGPIAMEMQVQRDDTPAGYRRKGRQSWLDHPLAWGWDSETLDWRGPQTGCPITREGTEVAFSAIRDASVYFVGAATPDPAINNAARASSYSAQGMVAQQTGPSVLALADEGKVLTGRRASGIVSGSSARLSGTSVAAPLATRAIADLLRSGAGLEPNPTPAQAQDETAALLGVPVGRLPAYPDSRLGAGTLPA